MKLLTSSSGTRYGPLSLVVLGGHPLETEENEWDFGPPIYKNVEEVQAAYHALSQINIDNPVQMNDLSILESIGIDPDTWGEEGNDFLFSYLREIIDLFRKAVKNKTAIIFWID